MAARRPSKNSPKRLSARSLTAYHEAGHAVLSAAINDTPSHVSIRPDGGTLGRSMQRMTVRPTSLAQVFLAGFAAEHLLTGQRPRQYDVEVGMAILAHDDPKLVIEGIESWDGYGAVQLVLRIGVHPVAEIPLEIEKLYEIARESLVAVWPAVELLAGKLVKHAELDRDAIEAGLGEFSLFTCVPAFSRCRGSTGCSWPTRWSARQVGEHCCMGGDQRRASSCVAFSRPPAVRPLSRLRVNTALPGAAPCGPNRTQRL